MGLQQRSALEWAMRGCAGAAMVGIARCCENGWRDVAWVYLFALGLVLWGACGAVMAVARKIWPLAAALYVHLAAAPLIAFVVAAVHKLLVPEFGALQRAALLTALIVVLDAAVVAPVFERSYAMFRSVIGTWAPFAAIFLASLAAGILIPA